MKHAEEELEKGKSLLMTSFSFIDVTYVVSNPLASPSPPGPNPFQHQSLFQRVNSSHKVAKLLEFQL